MVLANSIEGINYITLLKYIYLIAFLANEIDVDKFNMSPNYTMETG